MANRKPTVLVTGFGPFGPHKVNSSMQAVKALAASDITKYVNLVTEEIPVIYEYVEKNIPNLWKKHRPQLCIHAGVNGLSKTVLLEKCAHNDGYQRMCDVDQKFHKTNHCIPGAPNVMHTDVDLEAICAKARQVGSPCEICLSDDAGRYLCDFTYYTSLYHGDSPTVFIHLPPMEGPYTVQEMEETLRILILTILDELRNCKHSRKSNRKL
ncbi:pyroglutamyl-peptidase 1-like isoform X2 [Actinia tenebrosa]|uniref:Pyroglutamyl-peptidase 1-like isoform X2 n=1 Tax=Actinia tenebrosa TaxID=6105 RepID=A0A6P8IEQ1_ACTTE|nr:pyroglutamyl-peptidase 1-like isoform X2 [Actinia tenebrosa]